jgi:hypothetical protein
MTLPSGFDLYSFAVYPADLGDAFEPLLLDVPSSSQDAAARRAYFSVMALMAGRGLDVDAFAVCVWAEGKPGPPVGPGGIEER